MSTITDIKTGCFCWTELSTTDTAAAKHFYTQLFGWTYHDEPIGEGKFYSMFFLNGQSVGALYERPKSQAEQGVSPHWLNYVKVSSVDETVAKAKAQKANIMVAGMDVGSAGRMALFQDPGGATVALWQPKDQPGATVFGAPGSVCWQELGTRDVPACQTFYAAVFDWTHQTMAYDSSTYTIFSNGAQRAAGMMPLGPELQHVPSHWLTYFAVTDCDQSTKQAESLGAQTLMAPLDIPGTGRFSVVKDPQGAVFAVIQLVPMN